MEQMQYSNTSSGTVENNCSHTENAYSSPVNSYEYNCPVSCRMADCWTFEVTETTAEK